MYCTRCGRAVDDDAIYCPYCGEKIGVKGDYEGNLFDDYDGAPVPSARSRRTATVLAALGGAVGAENFYLGNTKKGLQQLALTMIGLPIVSIIWGLGDAAKLQSGEIDTDARGNYLKD